MSRYVDPQISTGLVSDEIDDLKTDSAIVQLRELRNRLTNETRKESGTLKQTETEKTKIYQIYKKADRILRSTKMTAFKSTKRTAR